MKNNLKPFTFCAIVVLTFSVSQVIHGMEVPKKTGQAMQTSEAKIYRQGKGEIDINGLFNNGWPEGYSFKKEGSYTVKRLSNKLIQEVPHKNDKQILESWNPKNFTSLSIYKQGDNLNSFKLVVHGLELKHVVGGIDDASFDDFVQSQLNDHVPLEDDFIIYYPYFFHKKTIISASVICESLTATFGNAGFVLSVPQQNYLCGAQADIHTPTDKDFYHPRRKRMASAICESLTAAFEGEGVVSARMERYSLPKLNDLISAKKDPTRSYNTEPTDKEIKLICQKMGFNNPTQQQLKNIKKISKKTLPAVNNLFGLPEVNEIEVSVYNEVSINSSLSVKDGTLTPKITGIFLRTSAANLENFIQESYIKKLLQVSEAFDLPILFINDGEKYETTI